MRNSRKLILINDVKIPEELTRESTGVIVGRLLADVPPKLHVVVLASDGYSIGGKCAHGVYIPPTSPWPDHSAYCSECCPYILLVKKDGVFKA